MSSEYVFIPERLTSFEFYNTVLPGIDRADKGNGRIILDFSHIVKIDPLVIPNLLCIGNIVKNRRDNPIVIYIPDTYYSGKVKGYLYSIGFTEYVDEYGLFEFEGEIWGGLCEEHIDPLCKTLYFSSKDSEDDIKQSIDINAKPFADKYISDFESFREFKGEYFYSNDIVDFLTELVINSKLHAKSISFATLHAKHSTKTIFISVSDCGGGFSSTIGKEMGARTEEEAILCGIYKRDNSKVYGLYNIIKQVTGCGGKVRIHSNDTQLIFTPKVYESFLYKKLDNDEFKKYNIRKCKQFDGVHVELEIPFERRNVKWW